MNPQSTIIITGAAGFIGSCMVQYLNERGFEKLILVDKFTSGEKEANWKYKKYKHLVDRELLFEWLNESMPHIDFIIHLGARTDTTEFDYQIHQELNVEFSQDIWNYCTAYNIPLIYASSAATYGAGELGYDDNTNLIENLKPLNAYGVSKNEFDKWAVTQINQPPFWTGLKFFNVYGPNEYHKHRMASVVFHSYVQIKKNGIAKLFKSYRDEFKDGEQLRDFIYVKDVVKVIFWMMKQLSVISRQSSVVSNERNNNDKLQTTNYKLSSGIYNLGSGIARTFNDLVKATFQAADKEPNIHYVEIPDDIKEKYQYFTQATMNKLRNAGYEDNFCTLEEGVHDYVRNYLSEQKIW